MEENENKVLFEIKDNIEIIQHLFVVLFAFITLIAMWVFGIGEGLELSKGHIFNRISVTGMAIPTTIYSIYKIINYNKETHKILFYKNKIFKISSSKEKNISTITEVYKRPIVYDIRNKIVRVSNFKKLLMLILFPIVVFFGLCLYLTTEIFFKKQNYKYCLILIGSDDYEVICILVENDKKEEVENYFLKYHNIDIQKLKTTWFTPIIKNRKG